MSVELISITPKAEWVIERAARVCYRSPMAEDEESRRKFISNLIAKGHESVIEHASATFEITCSRVTSHQLVRHRLASYSQESQRYVKQDIDEAYMPASVLADDKWMEWYEDFMYDCMISYQAMIDQGIPKEDARYALPSAMPTRIVMTANFREWRHIIKIRTSKHAQIEIGDTMDKVAAILCEQAPSVFEDLCHVQEE